MSEKTIVVSGYFDPLHVGHLEYLQNAKNLGTKLIVIVNNDMQATLKKGKPFMPSKERCTIMEALECVDQVVESIDDGIIILNSDSAVCECNNYLEVLEWTWYYYNGDNLNNTIYYKYENTRFDLYVYSNFSIKSTSKY